ncbi:MULTISPECIES: HlyD family efflux transporter periplasmic adaptor subunit [unclassified Microbulbifer]|uniref:HlyD family secretion protein n=1 Tax=unclassified Microbulbifer TaxID=2619833 RepID=UPI0027E3DEFD|nr:MULTISPECIES: HlyD family efflux transporter periplasmic adaptor subunit [unclassified Microbulbifer]
MSTPFLHTTRALKADGTRLQAVAAAIGLLLFAAWGLWFFTAGITVYKVSGEARLQQFGNTVQLSAPQSGRVVAIHRQLGDTVADGDALLQLDTSALDLGIAGENRVAQSLEQQLESLRREQELVDNNFQRDSAAQREQLALLRERHALLESNLEIQANITARYESLAAKQQGAQLDYLTAKRSQQQMAADTLETEAELKAAEERLVQLDADHRQSRAELARRLAATEQELAQADTRMRQQTLTADQYHLRAPIGGVVASLADINVGQMLEAGAVVASIQAPGEIRVQAQFEPAAALGHIRPGQRARVRLDGFAWTRYGELSARVERVAAAVQDGRVLVQLVIDGDAPPGLPVQHHLPAVVEIVTARKAPYQLLLQRAGEWMAGEGGNPPAAGAL